MYRCAPHGNLLSMSMSLFQYKKLITHNKIWQSRMIQQFIFVDILRYIITSCYNWLKNINFLWTQFLTSRRILILNISMKVWTIILFSRSSLPLIFCIHMRSGFIYWGGYLPRQKDYKVIISNNFFSGLSVMIVSNRIDYTDYTNYIMHVTIQSYAVLRINNFFTKKKIFTKQSHFCPIKS